MPPTLNKVFLIGNLTHDPDCRTTPGGDEVCSFSIAVNEGSRENPIVTFVKIEAWRKTAENCGRYLRKGSGVVIEGRLKLDSWEDRQTGERRQQLMVTAQNVQFMSRPRTEDGEDQDGPGGYQQQQSREAAPAPVSQYDRAPQAEGVSPQYGPDQDIPF